MEIQVRAVTEHQPDLIRKLVELEVEAFGAGGSNEWFMVPYIRYGRVFVLYAHGEVAGCSTYMRDWNDYEQAYLNSVSTRSDLRGQGLGRTMLDRNFRLLHAEGIRRVKLTVDPANKPALHLYWDVFRFKPVGFYRHEYGTDEDRLAMELDLGEYLARETGS